MDRDIALDVSIQSQRVRGYAYLDGVGDSAQGPRSNYGNGSEATPNVSRTTWGMVWSERETKEDTSGGVGRMYLAHEGYSWRLRPRQHAFDLF